MQINPTQRAPNAADIPLEKLAGNSQVSQAAKVAEVSRQFEAVLLRQILSNAQKTVFASTMNPESSATGIYRDLITHELAQTISHSNGLGLGNSLAAQLSRQVGADQSSPEPED